MAKTNLSRKVYTFADGSTGRSAKPGWTGLTFELLAPEKDAEGKAVVLETVTVSRDMFPAEVLECAIGHGLSQKIGDDLAGIETKAGKEEPPVSADAKRGFVDYALDRITAMVDNLKAGVWVEEGEGATGASNVTILFEAIVAAMTDAGKTLSDEQTAKIRADLKTEEYRKKAQANPAVKVKVEKIKLDRQKERAKAAEAAAKEAPVSMDDLLG